MFGKTRTFTVSVEGIQCNNCKARVEKAVLALKGVKTADMSVESKTITVVAKKSVTEDAVVSAILQAGYIVH